MRRTHIKPLALAVWLAVLLASCGGESKPEPRDQKIAPPASQRTPDEQRKSSGEVEVDDAPCPAGLVGCVSAKGVIAAVERVDPDGDGDAHFILVDPGSVTLPGVTVIDVAKDLRPRPLPGVGETLSGAGLVQRGSYGQKQIEAVEIRVEERD